MKTVKQAIWVISLGLVYMAGMNNALAGSQFIYVGVAPTYSMTNFDWTVEDTKENIINNTQNNTQIGVMVGYGVLINRIYIGVEGATQFGERTAASQTHDVDTGEPLSNKVTMSDIYVVDFRPGYVLNGKNSLIYGIVGVNSSTFQAKQTNSAGEVVQDSDSDRSHGIRLGAGYNLGLGRHFMARVEYVFTTFSTIEFSDNDNDNQTQSWKLKPYSNEINVGLAVVFNL